MHSVTVTYHDLGGGTRMRVSSAKEQLFPVEAYERTAHGLYFRVASGGRWRTMEGHVLPELHLQVARFDWCEGQGEAYDFYLDIVRVVETGACWVVRDLYLDLTVDEGRKVRVLDNDEYLEALAEGHFEPGEAEHALAVTHETLNALAEHGYSLGAYLERRGIVLAWS